MVDFIQFKFSHFTLTYVVCGNFLPHAKCMQNDTTLNFFIKSTIRSQVLNLRFELCGLYENFF